MINLENVTLCIVDTKQAHLAVKALEKTVKEINFKEVILFSDIKPFNFNEKFKFIQIDKINNLVEYSKFMVNRLVDFINTDYCFTIHHDGFVVNPSLWDDDFLKYDWIGAPWRKDAHFIIDNKRVGNGGVSIRSKRLMLLAKEYPLIDGHEDTYICCNLRNFLESRDITFAPLELASRFSIECGSDDLNVGLRDVFAFHGPHSKDQIEEIKNLIFSFYRDDIIKMQRPELIDWLRNEAGSSQPDYFYCSKKGNLTLQQIPEEYSQLLEIFKTSEIKDYLELGVANGGSFFVNSIFLQKTAQKLHCVDSLAYKGTHVQQTEEKIMSKVNKLKEFYPDKEFVFFNKTTDEFFKHNKNYYDCIFIDADHTYEGVKKDFENSLNFLNDSGIIIFHDIGNADTGVAKFWQEVKENFKDYKEFKFTKASWYNCGIGVIYT